jgi:hypothetical protein
VVGSLVLLTPLAGLAALGAIVPVCCVVVAARQGRRVAEVLGLAPARLRPVGLRAATAVAICALLGLAATQPIVRTTRTEHVRRSSQVLFVVDVSRSMLASDGPDRPSRLERARNVVLRLRRAVPDVPAGVAGLTDRVLPYVFATSDGTTFENVVRRSVLIEAPPPQVVARNATSFDALAAVPTSGFFPRSATHRTCVLVTDGETGPYSTFDVAHALDGARGCSLLVVQVWAPGERVYGVDGQPEAAYRPDDAAPTTVRRLAQVTRGQSFDSSETAQAAASLRRHAEAGPSGRATVVERQRRLTPLLAGVALALAVGLAAATLRLARFGATVQDAYPDGMRAQDRAA